MLRYISDCIVVGLPRMRLSLRGEQLVYVHRHDNALPCTRNCLIKQLTHPLLCDRNARQPLSVSYEHFFTQDLSLQRLEDL